MDSTPTRMSDDLMNDVLVWDVRTWSVAVEFWDAALPHTDSPLTCLEIGAGPGGPSLWLALRGHHVVCSNLADTRLLAEPLHQKWSVTDNIEYRDVDATALPYENHFDVVIFKSVLGGIGHLQAEAMAQILKALKPGGRLLFAENVRGTIFHRIARAIAYRIRGSSWHYLTLAQMTDLLDGFSSWTIESHGVLAMFGTTEARRETLAKVDDRVFNRITPRSWKYVSYGVATK